MMILIKVYILIIDYFDKNINQIIKMSSNFPKYRVKAGRFQFDQTTKKVKVSKDKGMLTLFTVIMSIIVELII